MHTFRRILLSTLYVSPSKPLRGREIHRIEQGVGDTVLFLWCSLASPLYSLRGVMDRGSGRSCSKVGGLEGLVNGLPKPTMGLLGIRMLYETEI